MSCPTVTTINRSEYIGNSLITINDNFSNLKEGICDNDVNISSLQQDVQSLDTFIVNLSTEVIHSVSKGLVKFSGFKDTNGSSTSNNPNRLIYSSYNISSVYRKNIGDYRVYFSSPLSTGNYLVLATNSEKTSLSGNYIWSQPYSTTKEYLEIKTQSSDGLLADADFISISII